MEAESNAIDNITDWSNIFVRGKLASVRKSKSETPIAAVKAIAAKSNEQIKKASSSKDVESLVAKQIKSLQR